MIACILKEKEREETRQMNDAQQIPMNTIHADCFMFHPNPSPTGGGYTLLNGNGTLLERQEILKPGVTNNELELLAVLRAAELLRPGGTILTDSQVVRTWVRKGRAKSRPDLNPHIQRCNNLVRAKKLAVRFVPRAKIWPGFTTNGSSSARLQSPLAMIASKLIESTRLLWWTYGSVISCCSKAVGTNSARCRWPPCVKRSPRT